LYANLSLRAIFSSGCVFFADLLMICAATGLLLTRYSFYRLDKLL
jgi:hypothetical protein